MNDIPENNSKQPSHIAYSVEDGKNDQSHWHRVGAAWPAKDGGLSLKLHAMPVDGRVALRSREELEKMRAERQQAQGLEQAQEPDHNPEQ